MKNKVLKAIKIIVIILLSVLIVTVVGGVILYNTVLKDSIHDTITVIDDVLENDEFFKEFVPLIDTPNENTDDIVQFGGEGTASEITANAQKNFEGKTDKSEVEIITPPETQKEYKSTYEYIKDNVAKEDFKTGVSFASRIDIKYILGLLKGGLTSEEKTELKAYLQKHFSSQEISKGISLYNKYSHLLK